MNHQQWYLNPNHFQDNTQISEVKFIDTKTGIKKKKRPHTACWHFIPTIGGGSNVKCWNLKYKVSTKCKHF